MRIALLTAAAMSATIALGEEVKPEQQTKTDVMVGVITIPNAASGSAVPIPNAAKTTPEIKCAPMPEITAQPKVPAIMIPNAGQSNEKTITYIDGTVTAAPFSISGKMIDGKKSDTAIESAPE